MAELLEIENLSVSFDTEAGEVQAVRGVSFCLKQGEVLAIVGESGCGKSVLCKSILKLLPQNARIQSGSIRLDGTEITGYRERDMRRLRGGMFSMLFQNPLTALNPTLSVGTQIAEAVAQRHPQLRRQALHARVIELMELVGIERAEERCRAYPAQFSGGMRQRCVLAIALASDPQILFADEPTTALDVTVQAQILDLLCRIQKQRGTATVLISHDLGVVARAADRVAVMYAGRIVEIGTAEEIFDTPKHPYTWALLRSQPVFARRGEALYTIPGTPPTLIDPPSGDAFACRNEYALAIDYAEQPPMFSVSSTHMAATWLLDARAPKFTPPALPRIVFSEPPASPTQERPALLDVRHLTHRFRLGKRAFVQALDDVSFQIGRGEIFGLVGESGSGKSTVARCVMQLCRPTKGAIYYQGVNLCDCRPADRRRLQATRQLIFQDSASSLNRRMKVVDIISEPLRIRHITPKRGSCRAEAEFQMKYVGLDASYLDQYPAELSGGMRQRVAIARALSVEPELLVADEPVSSLDVSIQAQILNLFKHLQAEHGFTFLFIAHDLAVVRYLCDRVGVMYRGRLVEVAPTEELFAAPEHPYTKALLSAIPLPDPRRERLRPIPARKDFPCGGTLTEIRPQHFVLRDGEEARE